MTRKAIPIEEFTAAPLQLWGARWLLLTSGDFAAGNYNAMTVGWGSLGTMWGKPFAQILVRPVRHTYGFMERYDSFTLCAFSEKHRGALQILGTRSGRDGDKIAAAGLTPIASGRAAAPGFAEAELIIECRKMYWDDLKPERFLDPGIAEHYPKKDYHRIYFGEILALSGEDKYRR